MKRDDARFIGTIDDETFGTALKVVKIIFYAVSSVAVLKRILGV